MGIIIGLAWALFTFIVVFLVLFASTFVFEFLFNLFSLYKLSNIMVKCRAKILDSLKKIFEKDY
nr:MAG TPA: hypothetical protein [Caudoviricetes sp.]